MLEALKRLKEAHETETEIVANGEPRCEVTFEQVVSLAFPHAAPERLDYRRDRAAGRTGAADRASAWVVS